MKRQNVRKLFLITSLLLFPVIIYYFSPALIIEGALKGVINGSFVVFLLMLVGSIFFGRLFCGYLCPAGGIQECAFSMSSKAPKQGLKNNIKYVIWVIWLTVIIACFILNNHNLTIDIFYQTDHGISIAKIHDYVIYYTVVLLIFVPSIIAGKRAFCHYLCWMAPFMVLGSKIGDKLHLKQLSLKADSSVCVNCHMCDKSCPMSLKVSEKVQKEQMADSECILCGACVDSCPKKAITYKLGRCNDEKNKVCNAGTSSRRRA